MGVGVVQVPQWGHGQRYVSTPTNPGRYPPPSWSHQPESNRRPLRTEEVSIPLDYGGRFASAYPHRESNPVLNFRKVGCLPYTLGTWYSLWGSNPQLRFRRPI
jgi:hypothetical protein